MCTLQCHVYPHICFCKKIILLINWVQTSFCWSKIENVKGRQNCKKFAPENLKAEKLVSSPVMAIGTQRGGSLLCGTPPYVDICVKKRRFRQYFRGEKFPKSIGIFLTFFARQESCLSWFFTQNGSWNYIGIRLYVDFCVKNGPKRIKQRPTDHQRIEKKKRRSEKFLFKE